MKNLLVTASTLALGLGLSTPVLAESDCAYPPCTVNPGTLLPGGAPGQGDPTNDRGEPDARDATPVTPVSPAPGPAPDPEPEDDGCGDGCGDDSAMGSGGDEVFLTLADLQAIGLA